MDKFN